MSKNKWARIIAAVCVCIMLISFTACGNSKKDETTAASGETTSASQEQSTTAAGETTTAAKQSGASDGSIVGDWEYESGGFTYTFKADGSGVYDAGGTLMPFTYTASGGKLSITYEGSTEPMVLDYEINGNKLNVKDSLGNDTIYNKK
ncbi:MAG: hypothetical protein IJI67_09265 [Clostridia bacterium]|nr:hypothetical protein [Clostridia bacterium]